MGLNMYRVNLLSGGLASWAAGKRVAQQHGTQDGGVARRRRKHPVHLLEQPPADARGAVRERRRRAFDPLEKLCAAQRCGQMDVLAGEMGAGIEGTWVQKIPGRPRAHQGLHAVAGAELGDRLRAPLVEVVTHAKAAGNGPRLPGHLHFIEVHFVAVAPR